MDGYNYVIYNPTVNDDEEEGAESTGKQLILTSNDSFDNREIGIAVSIAVPGEVGMLPFSRVCLT
jgi:hypothetical protein